MLFGDALNATKIWSDLRPTINALVERKKGAEEVEEVADEPVSTSSSTLNSRGFPSSHDAMYK